MCEKNICASLAKKYCKDEGEKKIMPTRLMLYPNAIYIVIIALGDFLFIKLQKKCG